MSETLSTSDGERAEAGADLAGRASRRRPGRGCRGADRSSPAASPGSAPRRACTEDSAIGSTSTFQTSVVPTTHSARLQAAVELTPEGNAVVSSSQWSARRTRVGDRVLLLLRRRRVGLLGDGLARQVEREVPVHRAVVGLHQELDLVEELGEVGHPAGSAGRSAAQLVTELAEELLEGRALEGVLVAVRRASRPACRSCPPRYAAAAIVSRVACDPPYAWSICVRTPSTSPRSSPPSTTTPPEG